MPYNTLLRTISDGEPVSASVANRTANELQQNTDYLKALLEAINLGQALFARGVTVKSDVLVGQPVYFNATTQQFEKALAVVENDTTTGFLKTADSSQVWGVAYSKENATKADILLAGYAMLSLANSVTGTVTAGKYYLSGSTPGGLVQQQPAVSIPVLMSDGNGHVHVQPRLQEMLDDHKHYKYALRCWPSGTTFPPAPGDRHVIDTADATLEGWLPANHATFNGNAPVGAMFGYNIGVSSLAAVWPPLPIQGAYLSWFKSSDRDVGGTEVPLGHRGLAIIDANGIWWMSNCYDDVPWPVGTNTSVVSSESSSLTITSESSSLTVQSECPRDMTMALTLYFTAPVFHSTATVVTSLKAASGSGLTITCETDGASASTGPLVIDFELGLSSPVSDEVGYLAFKSLSGNQLSRGPIVEGVKALTSNLTITGSTSRYETPGNPATATVYQGVVGIGLAVNALGTELEVQLVRLNNVVEQYYQQVTALGFPSTQSGDFRGRINVPAANVIAGTQMKLRFTLLGRAAGTLPAMTVYYRRIPRNSPTTTPAALPLLETSVALTTGIAVAVDQYVEVETAAFAVSAGDIVLFTLGRVAPDGYSGDVYLLRQQGVLV